MNWSWFGPKNGYSSGIASWQGLIVAIVCVAGVMAFPFWLPRWWALLAVAVWMLVFVLIVWLTYDKDALT